MGQSRNLTRNVVSTGLHRGDVGLKVREQLFG